MSEASKQSLSAIEGTLEENRWIGTLFERLPRLIASGPLECPTSAEYNAVWANQLKQLLCQKEEFGLGSQRPNYRVQVCQCEKLSYLSVNASTSPITLDLKLSDEKFRRLLKEACSGTCNPDDELTLVSLFSGLVLSVDSKLVALVTTTGLHQDCPPFLTAVDAANQGPLYVSFYLTRSNVECILDGTTSGEVRFEIHFFKSHIEKTRVLLDEKRGSDVIGARGKTYSEELSSGKNIDHIRNFKNQDSLVRALTESSHKITAKEVGDSKTYVVIMEGQLSVSFKASSPAERGPFTLLILPRLRNSIGSKHCYTPGLLRLTTESMETQFTPIQVISKKAEARAAGPKGTLCFCSLGACVNSIVDVQLMKEGDTFDFLNAKPGLNGFVAYFLGSGMYSEILQFLRVKKLVEEATCEDLQPLAEDICDIVATQRGSIVDDCTFDYVLKALMYASFVLPKRLECFTEFDQSDITPELIAELYRCKNFLNPTSGDGNWFSQYCEEHDKLILSKVEKARDRKATRGAVSFMHVSAKVDGECARFESFIKAHLPLQDNSEEASCKRLKSDQ